jgi:hypothetical protein
MMNDLPHWSRCRRPRLRWGEREPDRWKYEVAMEAAKGEGRERIAALSCWKSIADVYGVQCPDKLARTNARRRVLS